MIRLIAAIDRQRGIAKNGIQPWSIPLDEVYFTENTKTYGGNVLTGGTTFRAAYDSKPLAGRQNYILTHDESEIKGATAVNDLDKFLAEFADRDLWVAGGAAVFTQVIQAGKADELYLTHINADFGCDQFFPKYTDGFHMVEQGEKQDQNGFNFSYVLYARNS